MKFFQFSIACKRTNNANNATHYVKLGKKRQESSKRNYYIMSPRVIIKAITIIAEALLHRCLSLLLFYNYARGHCEPVRSFSRVVHSKSKSVLGQSNCGNRQHPVLEAAVAFGRRHVPRGT